MSDDYLPELEIAPDVSLEETRRYWLLEHAAPFIFCDSQDTVLPLHDVMKRLSVMEEWLKTGAIPEQPEQPEKPKSKLSLVKPNGE